MAELFTLVYQDNRRTLFIKDYRKSAAGVLLTTPGQEIIVDEAQKNHLLKKMNGPVSVFRLKGQSEGGK
jgi:hypothetical protein